MKLTGPRQHWQSPVFITTNHDIDWFSHVGRYDVPGWEERCTGLQVPHPSTLTSLPDHKIFSAQSRYNLQWMCLQPTL